MLNFLKTTCVVVVGAVLSVGALFVGLILAIVLCGALVGL